MWRNGYAPVCKTVYSGSIPDVASILLNTSLDRKLPITGRAVALPGYLLLPRRRQSRLGLGFGASSGISA